MSDDAQTGGLEERKAELFATITLLAGTKRDLVHARGARRLALIERQAHLEADKERLSHEVNSQYMYRNLQAFMNRVDSYDAERKQEASKISNEIGGLREGQLHLQAGFQTVGESLDGLTKTVARLEKTDQEQGKQISALSKDMAIVKGIIEARPEQRKIEAAQYEARQVAIEARQERIDAKIAEIEAERGSYTKEERADLTSTLLRMIMEYKAAHGDGIEVV